MRAPACRGRARPNKALLVLVCLFGLGLGRHSCVSARRSLGKPTFDVTSGGYGHLAVVVSDRGLQAKECPQIVQGIEVRKRRKSCGSPARPASLSGC